MKSAPRQFDIESEQSTSTLVMEIGRYTEDAVCSVIDDRSN